MFNPLEINTDDVKQLFDISATNVLINDTPTKAIITNTTLSETSSEDRHLHTLSKVSQGDVVTYQDEPYLVITETITKRHSKYRAIIRHCNFSLEFPGELERVLIGYDDRGRPIYDYIPGELVTIPLIVTDRRTLLIDEGAIRVGDNQILITFADTEFNRESFEINSNFEIFESEWKVLSRDFTRKGIVKLTCERV